MNHHDAGALLHQSVKFVEMRIEHVSAMSRAEDDDRRGVFQNRFVLGISIMRNNDGFHIQTRFVQRVGQDCVAGPMLMRHRPVAGLAGDENDFCLVGGEHGCVDDAQN